MINHARNLLANLLPDLGNTALAEELIDPAFVPLAVPPAMQLLRSLLFGSTPDRHTINYRCRQLLTAIHATPQSRYITAFDNRITYAIGTDATLVPAAKFMPLVSPLETTVPLVIVGNPTAPDNTGRLLHAYRVTVTSATTVTVQSDEPLNQNLVFNFSLTNGLSNPVPLNGSGYSALLQTAVTGSSWLISVINRPQWDIGQLTVNLAYAGAAHLDQLFGNDAVEPWLTFRNLWELAADVPARLSGLVLALIYRAELVRWGMVT